MYLTFHRNTNQAPNYKSSTKLQIHVDIELCNVFKKVKFVIFLSFICITYCSLTDLALHIHSALSAI